MDAIVVGDLNQGQLCRASIKYTYITYCTNPYYIYISYIQGDQNFML